MHMLSRRRFLQTAGMAGAAVAVAACQPKVVEVEKVVTQEVEKVVEKVVKETVIVEGTPQVVEKVVTEIVVATPAPQEAVTVRLWHHWGGDRVPLMDKMIADFMVKNPMIQVEATLQPWDQRLEKLLVAITSGDPPDVTMLAQQDMPPFVKGNALMPLDEHMAAAGIRLDEYYAPEAKAMVYKGQVWVLPNAVGGAQNIMFYIPAHFKEVGLDPDNPPTTWPELLDATQKLLVREGDGIKRLGCTLYGGADGFRHLLAGSNAPLVSDDGQTSEIDNDLAAESLDFLLQMYDGQGGVEEIAAWQSMTATFESDPFYNDLKSIHFSGGWYYFYIKTQAPDLEYRSAVAPVVEGNPWLGSYNSCWGYAIPRGALDLNAAWTLTKWLSYDEEGSCEFIKAQLQGHPLKSCFEDPVFKEATFWPVMDESLTRTKVYGSSFPIWNEQGNIMTTELEEVLYHRKSPKEALASISEQSQQALDEWWATE